MSRTGMSDYISDLRAMCNAGTADYTIAGVAYWTDDQVQTVLDRHRLDITEEMLTAIPDTAPGDVVLKRYYSAYHNLESGTAVFSIIDSAGNVQGTANYTADYRNGRFVWSADTEGALYYMTGRSYDVNSAAADIWRQKAGHFSTAVNFSTDNMRVDRGSMMNNALQMATYYEQQAPAQVVTLYRSDTWPDMGDDETTGERQEWE